MAVKTSATTMKMELMFLCSFFFQAEDGIRDVAVTGVQMCALPISSPRDLGVFAPAYSRTRWRRGFGYEPWRGCPRRQSIRSEERRVGTAGRYRGWTEMVEIENMRANSSRELSRSAVSMA